MLIRRIGLLCCLSILPSRQPSPAAVVQKLQAGEPALEWADVDVSADIEYLDAGRKEKLDLYRPRSGAPRQRYPGIVVIHGGGWKGGRKGDKREQNIAYSLARSGYVCASIDYRLSRFGDPPSWPQALFDCKSAVQFLRRFADRYQIDPDRIGVIGGSAGGHLALMVGLTDPAANLEPPSPYAGVPSRVQAVVDLYGPTNLLTWQWDQIPEIVPLLLGASRSKDPALWTSASPVHYVTSDDPPVLMLHGTEDSAVPVDQSRELRSKLVEKGVRHHLEVIEKAEHSFDLQPPQKDLRPLVIGFFNTHLKKAKE
ncbi:MAG: alpha/beta hydrolase [Acidimicrobiia bacterium]|nr:alpha/beta hydrolase [Acidimicrobiia bacterium]